MSDARIRLLIVEDEADIRRFLRLALENEGFETYEADTVKRALIEAGTRRPELVVLDLGLPDGDGVDFIRDLRGWSAVPVIVLSARSSEADKIEVQPLGEELPRETPHPDTDAGDGSDRERPAHPGAPRLRRAQRAALGCGHPRLEPGSPGDPQDG